MSAIDCSINGNGFWIIINNLKAEADKVKNTSTK